VQMLHIQTNRRDARVRQDDLKANREMMGNLRGNSAGPDMNPEVEFLSTTARSIGPPGPKAENLGDDTVLRELLENVVVPATTLMAGIERQEVKDRLRHNTDRAVERGVFGAPTFFVGSEMFWGNDRFDFVEEALRKWCGMAWEPGSKPLVFNHAARA
jgi:DSBA-like thioredoxin domain